MKVKIVETNDIIATHGGNLLAGALLAKTKISEKLNELTGTAPDDNGITTGDIGLSYIGILLQAQPEFEAVEQFREDEYFAESLGIRQVPSCSTLRQRMNLLGEGYKDETITTIMKESNALIRAIGATISPCHEKYIALDIDVTPFDNSNTKKEGVSWTYKNFDGYAPIFAYIGEEGYCINASLREGSQHCQKDTPEFLRQSIENAKTVTGLPILVRLDSGNDAADNIAVMQKSGTKADYIIKRNPRKESLPLHFSLAEGRGREIPGTRKGKRIFVYENEVKPQG